MHKHCRCQGCGACLPLADLVPKVSARGKVDLCPHCQTNCRQEPVFALPNETRVQPAARKTERGDEMTSATATVSCCGSERATAFCPDCGSKLESDEQKLIAMLQAKIDSINNEKRESETKAERLSLASGHLETLQAIIAERDALLAEKEAA